MAQGADTACPCVLEHARSVNPSLVTKTSIILGFGERDDEIRQTMRDMRDAGVEIFTLGQYLRPSRRRVMVLLKRCRNCDFVAPI